MSFFRKAILTVTENKIITRFFNTYGMRIGVSRFIAGETQEKAVEIVRNLNQQGLMASLDYLGESITSRQKALSETQFTINLLDAIHHSGIISNISVKLTHFGLDIDRDLCLENMHTIIRKAKECNNFVRIDMEDSPRIDNTLYIFQQLLGTYGKAHVGAVIQSYLHRSEEDVIALGKKGVNLRIVKGAYKEPKEVAFQNKRHVDDQYIKLVQLHLQNGCYTGIATHDPKIITTLQQWITKNQIPKDIYEFQMLYGICSNLQYKLAQEGHRVRTYIPFGRDWYAYFTRRIAERPANAIFVLRNLFKNT